MEPLYTMSSSEIIRLQAIQALEAGALTLADVADRLRISIRQAKRLRRRYRDHGPSGLISKRRGRPSNNRADPQRIAEAIERVRERYVDFGPTLASEKLAADGIPVKRERLRQAMIAAGIWQPDLKRRRELHPPRERRPQRGELIQGDGSPHAWFEKRGPRCTLLLLIDDATTLIASGYFAPSETTEAYFEIMHRYIQQYGKPFALYVDKHSVFRTTRLAVGQDPKAPTQFGRAMQELDIELICANSPQAKGRVERANRTLQDRLVKELRLHGISDIASANAFLPAYLNNHNQRFAIQPRSEIDAHRPLQESDDLRAILAHVEERTVSKDLTFKFQGRTYQLTGHSGERRMQHQRVLIRRIDGTMSVLHQNAPMAFVEIASYAQPVVEAKSVNDYIDRSRLGQRLPDPKKQRRPDRTHPWRL
jgi:transposase